ncbi:MAG: thioredoxin [Coleofasciculus sp. C1-SOL-03]|jgi:thioredoxin 1|uniref:thioredoxin n=1 Tax=Coleofasciculus sp. C1-SOL-03 TaxID=3069522 RepID=UPI0032F350FC
MVLSVNEQTFKQCVLENSKMVLVDFWAPWCGLCRLIQPMLEDVQQEWSDRIEVVRVNADNSLRLASTYQLKSLPTLLLFENGQVVERLEGFQGRDDLRLAIQNLIGNNQSQFSASIGQGLTHTALESATQSAA